MQQIILKSTLMMKKILVTVAMALVMTGASAQKVMKKLGDGTYVVNTTSLADDVQGYMSTTPVEIHIKKNIIVKVVALKNDETPKYFAQVKKDMLTKYEGISVKKFQSTAVDGVTGATFSSDAVKENVRRGVAYYLKNKRKL